MSFHRVLISALVALWAVLVGTERGWAQQAQTVWQFAVDPGLGIGSADVLTNGAAQIALRCRASTAPVSQNSFVTAEPRVGVATLLIPPAYFAQGQDPNQPVDVTLALDGNFSMRFPAVIGRPEGVYTSRLLLNGPLIARMRSARQMTLSVSGGQNLQLGMTGSAQTLAQLAQYCIPSVAQQALIPKPGFDCARAQTGVEVTICSFPDLAEADTRMAQAYATAQQQGRVTPQQHGAWIRTREQCGADVRCILERTTARAAELGGALTQPGVAAVQPIASVPGQAVSPQAGAAQSAQAAPQPGMQLQTATPAPTPNAPPVVGQNEVSQALLIWMLGQRPALLSDDRQVMQYRNVKFPAGAPQLAPRAWNDRSSRIGWAQQMVAYARSRPFPQNVIYDLDAQIYRNSATEPFRLVLSGSSEQRLVLREQRLAVQGNRGALSFVARNPFAAVLPDPIAQGAGAEIENNPNIYSQKNTFKLRLHLTLEAPELSFPIDATQLPYVGGQALGQGRMVIRQVELLKFDRSNNANPNPQPVLMHRWTPPQTPPPIGTEPLDTVQKVAAFYGGAVQGGRLIRFSWRAVQEMGLQLPQGSFSGDQNGGQFQQTADFALRLGTILKAAPERQMSFDLTQSAAFQLLDEIERDQVLPLGFSTQQNRNGAMNELERVQALRAAEPKMREIAKARMPAMPMPVSAIILAQLEEYDLGLQGFPVRLNLTEAGWLPNLDLQGTLPGRELPDFIPVPEAEALTLLQQLDVDALQGRTVPVRIDYTIAGGAMSARRATPIDAGELPLVNIGYAVERIVVFADAAFSRVLLDYSNPEAEAQLAAFQRFSNPDAEGLEPPEPGSPETVLVELQQSTVEALLAPLVARGHTELAQNVVQTYPAIRSAPRSTRPQLIQQELDRIKGLSRDGYWIQVLFTKPAYDPVRGVMTLDINHLAPVVLGNSHAGGAYLPAIQPDPMLAKGEIPISQADFDAVMGMVAQRGTLLVKAGLRSASETALFMGPAEQLALLAEEPQQGRLTVPRMVVQLAEPKRLEPKVSGDVVPPDLLYLDHEGIDLIALSKAPDLFGDPGLERMMIERAARERQAQAEGQSPVWGAFFEDPGLPLEQTTRAELLPKFREWTLKRIAALPEMVAVPLANRSGHHPATGCQETFELRAGDHQGRAVSDHYDVILGEEAAALKAAFGEQKHMGRTLPGSDRVFALMARPTLTGGSARPSCPYLTERRLRDAMPLMEGFDVSAAGYVDAVIIARGVPHPAGIQGQLRAVDYRVRLADVQLLDIEGGANDGAGFKGVLKLSGKVEEVAFWTLQPDRTSAISATLVEKDWNAALGTELDSENLDIVGLKLGMSEAEFLEQITARMPGGVGFASMPTARPNIFSHAVGRADPAKSELISAITADASEGKPVLGILRVRDFAPGKATIPALVKLLKEKYGPPSWSENGDQLMAWGVPVRELDRTGVCGSGLIGGRGQAPQIGFDAGFDQSTMRQLHPSVLQAYGWPSATVDPNASQALEYCRPSVTVRIQETGQGGLQLVTWLFDRTASVALAEDAEAAAEEAAPDLDL